MVDHPPKGGGIVTQQYVLVLSVHLYRLFTLRGLAVQISKISTSFNVVLPRVIQHLIFTTHYIYKLIQLITIRAVWATQRYLMLVVGADD